MSELLYILEEGYKKMINAKISNFCAENNHGLLYYLLNFEPTESSTIVAFIKDVEGQMWCITSGVSNAFNSIMIVAHAFDEEHNFEKNFRKNRQVISRG